MWAFVGPSRVKREWNMILEGLCLYEYVEQLLREREREGVFGFLRKGISFLLLLCVYSCPLGAGVQFLTQVKNEMYSSMN